MYGRLMLLWAIGLTTLVASGQKKVSKKIIDVAEQNVQIDAGNCFHIDLGTTEGDELIVEAFIEGEYSPDLTIKVEEDGNTLLVSTDFLPNFQAPNDKLSAHKVVSIALKVRLPRYSHLKLYGTYSNISASGLYQSLDIAVADGNCFVQAAAESAVIKTQSGEIRLSGIRGEISAQSKYGKVHQAKVPQGDYSYELYSIEGDIWINVPIK